MQLFHYHYWTDQVEETEKFYIKNGFQTAGRFTKDKGGIKSYQPPRTWDDFRSERPRFRIIEVRKGAVNVTFGEGKKPKFDHIGYLVTEQEHAKICKQAKSLGWHLNIGSRRTFVGTPFNLRMELQRRKDVIAKGKDRICSMDIAVKKPEGTNHLRELLGRAVPELRFTTENELALKKVMIASDHHRLTEDPNGVLIESHQGMLDN